MSTAHVCVTCRIRFHWPFHILQNYRLLSTSAPSGTLTDFGGATQKQSKPGRGRSFDEHGNSKDNSNGNVYGSSNQNGKWSDGVRGRYSRKDLRPEQLLDQLHQPWQPHNPPTNALPAKPRYRSNDNSNQAAALKGDGRTNVALSPSLATKAQAFIDSVNNEEMSRAWSAMLVLAQECSALSTRPIRALLRTDDFMPVLGKFINKSTRQWLDSMRSTEQEAPLVAPGDIFKALYTMRIAKPSCFRPTLWHVASELFELRAKGVDSSTLVNGLRELARMWRYCLAMRISGRALAKPHESASNQQIPIGDETDWSFLPSPESFPPRHLEPRTTAIFEQMLNDLLPLAKNDPTPHHAQRQDYASAAFCTLDLFRTVETTASDGTSVSVAELPDCSPFVDLLDTMLNVAPKPRVPIGLKGKLAMVESELLRQSYAALVSRLNLAGTALSSVENGPESTKPGIEVKDNQELAEFRDFDSSHKGTGDELELNDESSSYNFAERPTDPAVERFAKRSIARLGKALERRDMYLAEQVRSEIYAFVEAKHNRAGSIPLEVYEHLMLTLLSVGSAKVAVDVWNHTIQAGYKPTVKTYTVMMRGASASRDISGMEAFWRKMRNAGYQPDEHAWSVRVYGLLKQRLVRQGLQALNDMGREWLAAAKTGAARDMSRSQKQMQLVHERNLASELIVEHRGSIDGVPRPNIVVMNSAISALAQAAEGEIPNVLAWGRSFGVEPDLTTYNALLNIAMRHGQPSEALDLLRRMQQRGVEANSTTWTVLLTALFHGGFLDGLDHTQQQEKILSFVKSVESTQSGASGIDEKGYALIIDRLLKHHSNHNGAEAVLQHMTESGRAPNTHMYTILMTSYFQKSPQPDLAAVETLWERIKMHHSGHIPVDNVFYDRMIEGYATHHRLAGIQPALGFLNRVRQAGMKPGWKALEAVARAFAERNDWNRLRALVDDVRESLREARGATQHTGQRNFWNFIIDTGLLRDEGITDARQLLPAQFKMSPLLEAGA